MFLLEWCRLSVIWFFIFQTSGLATAVCTEHLPSISDRLDLTWLIT